MPITTKSAARVNTEESNRDDMGDREEQENTCSVTSDDNFLKLFAMMRQQTERLIGDINEKIQRISKRQDWVETRLDRVDTDLAYVSSELEKFDTCQRNTVPVDVECLKARLDVVENRTGRFGERIETIQKELVPKLKESVLEEL